MSTVVDTGGEFIGPGAQKSVRLSDDALKLLTGPEGPSRFVQACGDSFVTSYRRGGRMNALLTISNLAKSDKERIEAEAKGGFGGFSANASFRKSVETASASNNLEISFEQVGGAFTSIPATLDEFTTKFTTYTVDENFNPRPYVFHTQNYRSLANWPASLENRVSPVDQEYLVLSYYNFSDMAADYDRVIREPRRYAIFLAGGESRVKEHRDIALRTARNIDKLLWDCVENFDCSLTALDAAEAEYINMALKDLAGVTFSNGAPDNTEDAAIATASLAFPAGLVGGYLEIAEETVSPPAAEGETPTSPSETQVSPDIPPAEQAAPVSSEVPAVIDKEPVILPTLAVSYHRLLAGLPILKNGDATGFTATAGRDDEAIVVEFKEWLIANRLRPISQPHCRRSANHPLCLTDREMGYILSLVEISADPLKPTPGPAKEPKVTPPTPKPPPPPCETKASEGWSRSVEEVRNGVHLKYQDYFLKCSRPEGPEIQFETILVF
ncbi:hypothetical protein SAMN04489859_106512 [Paracoccus alcaliphilus]|uniref:Uncharacterized protein n=1 Tax=Paracoccus alcaliphilus TaxID=34002 RepID=A0A1H8NMT5_9RHOB|nr:hypothetical protein [Paracoccus alcaliphilus]SEO30882.1 hypothetical protein SAMN04489859_106512 [Paracoccus alcaliphilus]